MALIIAIYCALALFFIGSLIRILRILTMPVHLRWELYPVPHEPCARARYGGSYFEETDWWTRPRKRRFSGEVGVILQEVFLLKGVWRHNRELWPWSWLLHFGLYSMIGAAVLTLAGALQNAAGVLPLRPNHPVALVLWAAMISGTIGATGIVAIRSASTKLRPFTSPWAWINLSVLLFVFTTGLLNLSVNPSSISEMILFSRALVAFRAAPGLHSLTAVHASSLALFVAYFPFTHMTHMYMKYFTYHAIRWDDSPCRSNTRIHASIEHSLSRNVDWAAPHILGEGKKSWSDVSSEGAIRGAK
ncbi:MAG TPA: hypothetical protein VE398_24245 [Acidobacteriota bacterium]|nr:hypothetical protein [Acidobacteriota bacterium]